MMKQFERRAPIGVWKCKVGNSKKQTDKAGRREASQTEATIFDGIAFDMNITDAEKATTSTKKTSSDEDLTENEHPLLMGINSMKVVFNF